MFKTGNKMKNVLFLILCACVFVQSSQSKLKLTNIKADNGSNKLKKEHRLKPDIMTIKSPFSKEFESLKKEEKLVEKKLKLEVKSLKKEEKIVERSIKKYFVDVYECLIGLIPQSLLHTFKKENINANPRDFFIFMGVIILIFAVIRSLLNSSNKKLPQKSKEIEKPIIENEKVTKPRENSDNKDVILLKGRVKRTPKTLNYHDIFNFSQFSANEISINNRIKNENIIDVLDKINSEPAIKNDFSAKNQVNSNILNKKDGKNDLMIFDDDYYSPNDIYNLDILKKEKKTQLNNDFGKKDLNRNLKESGLVSESDKIFIQSK